MTRLALALLVTVAACGGEDESRGELTLQFIQRLPALDYVWGSERAEVEGWPAVGEEVTWRLHVRSWAARAREVTVIWRLDGAELSRQPLVIPSAGVATADLRWPWTFERHQLSAVVGDEELAVFTDALSVGFYVERSLYEHFRANQPRLAGVGSSSFEDWAQRQIARYNQLLAEAIFPETPTGVRDRLRLDRITVVADGALPLDPRAHEIGGRFAPEAARPNLADRSVDLQWGFPASAIDSYRDLTTVADGNQFYYSGFVQHELGHARSMIDVYGVSVYDGLPGHAVEITEGGVPVAGSAHMPATPVVFNGFPGRKLFSSEEGLMAATWTRLDRTSAVMWNRIAGRRARFGNYNEPENIGDFLDDLPARTRLALVDQAGAPLAGAAVRVYQGTPLPAAGDVPVYGRRYDDVPDLERVADAAGVVELPRNPFSSDGPVIHTDAAALPFSNATAIVRVAAGGRVGYAFLTATELAVQAAIGHREVAELRLVLTMR